MSARSAQLERVLERLGDGVTAREAGKATARCPAHEDRAASLSVSDGDRGVMVNCFAGCPATAVVAALGLQLRDLFFEPRVARGARPKRGPEDLARLWAQLQPERRWTELYALDPALARRYLRSGVRWPGDPHCDSHVGVFAGEQLVGIKSRLPAGRTWQGGSTEKYRAAPGSKMGDAILLLAEALARPQATVVVCAGEKDALVAASHLDPARWAPVTGCGGEGKIPRGLGEALAGRRVVVAYDPDATGQRMAAQLWAQLRERAAEVRVAVFPEGADGVPKGEGKWDVAAIVLGRGRHELERLLEAALPEPPASWGAGAPPSRPEAREHPRPPRERPQIVLSTRLHELTTEAERALAAAELGVYQRGGELVRVTRVEDHARIALLPEPSLLELCSAAADWVAIDDEGEVEPKLPSRDAVKALAARADWASIPPLERVVHGPTLRPDGTVLDEPGYDRAARTLYEPRATVTFPRVAERPTKAEARAALDRLLELVSEFPWVAPSDRSAWLALVLTLVARPAIAGPLPLFLVRATAPGTGKSLLIDVAALIGTDLPGEPPRMAQCRDRDGAEEAKRLLALGLDGDALAMIDNIEAPLGSDVLAAALTSRTYKGRLLGHSRTVDVTLPVFVATGNNVVVRGDLARRVVPIDLDARVEHPEARVGWKLPQLVAHVRGRRGELRAAALTAVRWFFAEGCPAVPGLQFGSYEAWSAVVPSALLWLGEADPLGGRARIYEGGDPEGDARRAVLELWSTTWGGLDRTAIEVASGAPEALRVALAGLGHGLNHERLDVRRLGYALRSLAGRIVGGRRLEGDRQAGVVRWRVVAPGAGQGESGQSAQAAVEGGADRAAGADRVDDDGAWEFGRE